MKCKKCGETTTHNYGWNGADKYGRFACTKCDWIEDYYYAYYEIPPEHQPKPLPSPTQLDRFKEFFEREGYKCKTSKYYDTTRLSILVQDKSFTTFHEACFYFDKEGKLVK